jgi:hypothetical protein
MVLALDMLVAYFVPTYMVVFVMTFFLPRNVRHFQSWFWP